MIKQIVMLVVVAGAACVASDLGRADELPQAVLDIQSLRLSSLRGDAFAFQFYRNNFAEVSEDRWWMSSNKKPSVVTFIKSRLPLIFHFQQQSFLFMPEGILRQSPTPPWEYSIDGDLVLTGRTASPDGGESVVAIDLPSCLGQLAVQAESRIEVRRNGENLSWHFKCGENWSYDLQLRTPNDAVKLGTALQRWHVESPNVRFGISALTVGSMFDVLSADGHFDMKVKNVEQMPEISDETLLRGGSRSVEGYHAFAALSAVSATDHFPEKSQHRIAIRKLESDLLPEGKFIIKRTWIREFSDLCRQLRVYAAHSQDQNELPIDDSAVRWSRIEQLQEARLFYATEFIVPKYLQASLFSIADRIQLVGACAELGESQYLQPSRIFAAEHGDLYRSILNAHHQHPYTDADIQRCFDYLEKVPENSPASHCLIESLILMGQIEKLSPNTVDRWYGDVMFAGSREDQLELFRQLTLVKSGREWLSKRLTTLGDQLSDTDYLALEALHQRATATQATSRWDFMTEQECNATLSLIEKLRPTP